MKNHKRLRLLLLVPVVGLLLACVSLNSAGTTTSALDPAVQATFNFNMKCDAATNAMSGSIQYADPGTNAQLPNGFSIYGDIPSTPLQSGTTCADLNAQAQTQAQQLLQNPPPNPLALWQGTFRFVTPTVDCSSTGGACGGYIIYTATAAQLAQCPAQLGVRLVLVSPYLDLAPYSTDGHVVCMNGDTPPSITVNPTSVEGNTTGGWIVSFSTIGSASDAEDAGGPAVACTPAIGSVLPLGTTTVACTATDSVGLTATSSAPITVQDTTPPTITCPANVAGLVGAPVTLGSATATDIVDPKVTITNNAPASFPPGSTTVTWTATDHSGNSATCGQTVTLRYVFTGFAQPIANGLPNAASAGQTVPVKWRLTDASGAPISDPASFLNLTSEVTSGACGGTATAVETSSGSSGLQYLGSGAWQYNWQTPTTYAGQCRTMSLNLADGTQHTASFTFK